MIRRITLIFAALAIAVPALAGIGSAAASAVSCQSTYGHSTLTGTEATAFWEQNAAVHHGCGYTGRTHIHCTPDGGVTFKSEFGGPVVAEHLNDTAKCPSGYNLIKAGLAGIPSRGQENLLVFRIEGPI